MPRVHVCSVAGLLAALLVLTAARSEAGQESDPWEVPIGAEHVRAFPAPFIPSSYSYTAVAVREDPQRILVVPFHLYLQRPPEFAAQPDSPAEPPARASRPVYRLDRRTGRVTTLTLAEFRETPTLREDVSLRRASAAPLLRRAGSRSREVLTIRRGNRELAAAGSWDSQEETRTTFGIPSPMPFLGRQHFFEDRSFHSGTVFLEVFDAARPHEPLVQLRQRFRDHPSVPLPSNSFAWVKGADPPMLVVVDPGEPRGGREPAFLLVTVPF